MSDKNLKKILPILCILWLCLIFFLSSDADSSDKTLSFSERVLSQIQGDPEEGQINGNADGKTEVDVINLFIRKSGHFLEYLVLSVLLLAVSKAYGMNTKKAVGFVLLLCFLIAGLDEFYQGFIPGRNAAVLDSLIDFSGAVIGVLGYVGIGRLIGKPRM